MEDAIAVLKQQGAIIVDPVEIPSITAPDPGQNFLSWEHAGAPTRARAKTRIVPWF